MSITFSNPDTASGGIKWGDYLGNALIVAPQALDDINTAFGTKQAVRADIVVLDGPHAGENLDDVLIFPTVLRSQTKGKLGEHLLVRLGQGNAKPGQSAPWVFDPADAAALKLGAAWVSKQENSGNGNGSKPADDEQPPF